MGEFEPELVAEAAQALRRLRHPDGCWGGERRSLTDLVGWTFAQRAVGATVTTPLDASADADFARLLEKEGSTDAAHGARLLRDPSATSPHRLTPLAVFYEWLARGKASIRLRPPPGWARRHLSRWAAWPDWDRLAISEHPERIATGAALLALALEGPLARDRARAREAVLPALELHVRKGLSLVAAAPALVCFRALGRSQDAARIARSLEQVTLRPGGWLRTPETDRLETAEAVLALVEGGTEEEDADVSHGCAFLARTPGADVVSVATAILARRRAGEEVLDADATLEEHPESRSVAGAAAWLTALVALGASASDPRVTRARDCLLAHQRADGSWFDPRTTATTHAMALALEAILLVGPNAVGDPTLERSIHFLTRTQNIDGGWGFDEEGSRSLSSTVEATAGAVICLSRYARERARPMYAIDNGVRFLAKARDAGGGWPPGQSVVMPTILGLRALVAQAEIREQHLASAAKLVRNRRIAKKKSAAAGPRS